MTDRLEELDANWAAWTGLPGARRLMERQVAYLLSKEKEMGKKIKFISTEKGTLKYKRPTDLPGTPGSTAEGKSGVKSLPTDQRKTR